MFKKKKIKDISAGDKKLIGNLAITLFTAILLISGFLFLDFSDNGKVDFLTNKFSVNESETNDLSELGINPILSILKGVNFITNKDQNDIDNNKLEKIKTNILIVGIGGGKHDAPNLTDTIILASINGITETVSMLSIPRDLYVDYDGNGEGKINQIYALSKSKTSSIDLGMKVLEKKITEITGESIDYYIMVDFNGFSKFIDAIGGVDVNIPENLVDYEYPDGNGGYRTLIIRKGDWTLNGDVALMYARSRHSTSDFDRSLRQQQIIAGIKDKLQEGGFLSKIYKIKEFYNVFSKYVQTDIGLLQAINIYESYSKLINYQILSFNLNDSCFYRAPDCQKGGFLYLPQRDLFGGASVLLPTGAYKGSVSKYDELKEYMNFVFNKGNIYKENFQINIFNAARERGIATDMATILTMYGFNIPSKDSLGNVKDKIFEQSLIYYISEVEKSETLDFLKNTLNIAAIKVDKPLYSKDENTKIEIILGNDYKDILKNLGDKL